jgi:hypothetical protein
MAPTVSIRQAAREMKLNENQVLDMLQDGRIEGFLPTAKNGIKNPVVDRDCMETWIANSKKPVHVQDPNQRGLDLLFSQAPGTLQPSIAPASKIPVREMKAQDVPSIDDLIHCRGLWLPDEDIVIAAIDTDGKAAVRAYRKAFPKSPRTDKAIKLEWSRIRCDAGQRKRPPCARPIKPVSLLDKIIGSLRGILRV